MKTAVTFKKSLNPYTDEFEIIAFFIHTADVLTDRIDCYSHIGQHSTACLTFWFECELATPTEYNELLNELVSIGYDPDVKQFSTTRDW